MITEDQTWSDMFATMLRRWALYGLDGKSNPSKGQLKKKKRDLQSAWVAEILDADPVWNDQMPKLIEELKSGSINDATFASVCTALIEDRVRDYNNQLTKRKAKNEKANRTRNTDRDRMWREESVKSGELAAS